MLIEALHKQSNVSMENLVWLSLTASKRYKSYEIPKRSGGMRLIEHPSRSLKAIQRWISKSLLRKLPIHAAAMAYAAGSSIRKNAEIHVGSKFTLRLDFSDFFPSFGIVGITEFLYQANESYNLSLNRDDVNFVARIVSRNGRLTIGAPSSPILTNAMMFEFDRFVYDYCASKGFLYSRYADDLFISTDKSHELHNAASFVDATAKNFRYASLIVNTDKTAYLSKRYRRTVTGLVLTPDDRISIGRDRKREIKSLVFSQLKGDIDGLELARLKGLLAFASDCDPEFYSSLKRKYGDEAIMQIVHGSAVLAF